MAKVKKKAAGRPPGAANKKSEYTRSENFRQFRCSEGFIRIVEMLVSSGMYKSKADVLHEALQKLAYGKDVDVEHYNYWRGKIQ